jgi:hypothetical protein
LHPSNLPCCSFSPRCGTHAANLLCPSVLVSFQHTSQLHSPLVLLFCPYSCKPRCRMVAIGRIIRCEFYERKIKKKDGTIKVRACVRASTPLSQSASQPVSLPVKSVCQPMRQSVCHWLKYSEPFYRAAASLLLSIGVKGDFVRELLFYWSYQLGALLGLVATNSTL